MGQDRRASRGPASLFRRRVARLAPETTGIPNMSATVLHVFVFRNGAYIGSEIFATPELIVGCGEAADIHLTDEAVGDAHAILTRDDREVRIVDLGHPAGTSVNGQLTQHEIVTPKDEIQLGSHAIRFKLVRAADASAGSSGHLPQSESLGAPISDPSTVDTRENGRTYGTVDEALSETFLPGSASSVAPESHSFRTQPERFSSTADAHPSFLSTQRGDPNARGPQPPDGSWTKDTPSDRILRVADLQLDLDEVALEAQETLALLPGESPFEALRPPTVNFGESTSTFAEEQTETPESYGARDASDLESPFTDGKTEVLDQRVLGQDATLHATDRFEDEEQTIVYLATPQRSALLAQAATQTSPPSDRAETAPETHPLGISPMQTVGSPSPPAASDRADARRTERPHGVLDNSGSHPPNDYEEEPSFQIFSETGSVPPTSISDEPSFEPALERQWDGLEIIDSPLSEPRVGSDKASTSGYIAHYTEGPDDAPRPTHRSLSSTNRISDVATEKHNTLPPPSSSPSAHSSDEDDDGIEPSFSLTEAFIHPVGTPSSGGLLSIIHIEKHQIRGAELLHPRTSIITLGSDPRTAMRVQYPHIGHAEVHFPRSAEGYLETQHHTYSLQTLANNGDLISGPGDTFTVHLNGGQRLNLEVGTVTYRVGFANLQNIPQSPRWPPARLGGAIPRALGSSLVAHAVLALMVGFAAPAASHSGRLREQRIREVWATVEPSPKRLPDPAGVDAPVDPPPDSTPPQKVRPTRSALPKERPSKARRTPPQVGPRPKPPRIRAAGVLGALHTSSIRASGPHGMLSAAPTMDAMRAPGASSYRVGALVSKAATSLIGAGAPPSLSRGTAGLLRGDTEQEATGLPEGSVPNTSGRGRVQPIQASNIKVRGKLGRSQIAKVLMDNLTDIQECYDYALNEDPTLSGQLTLEWTIRPNGRVGTVKQLSTSLNNQVLTECIAEYLQHWQFPRPRRGSVTAVYPYKLATADYGTSRQR